MDLNISRNTSPSFVSNTDNGEEEEEEEDNLLFVVVVVTPPTTVNALSLLLLLLLVLLGLSLEVILLLQGTEELFNSSLGVAGD